MKKEIERIKEQMRQMIESSAKIDGLEDLIHPDGDGLEIAAELRKKEYRLKKLQEAMEVLEREKLRSEEGKRIYARRRYTVEPAFGEIKWDGKKPSMDLRGPVKVRREFSLLCLAHN